MSKITRPMLASNDTWDPNDLCFPVLASVKLDGIRCLRVDGRTVSRKFIDIPNKHIQAMTSSLPDELDGELIIEGSTFNQIQHSVMSEAGEPDFKLYVFDYVPGSLKESYEYRMQQLEQLTLPDFCVKVLPRKIKSVDELLQFEQEALNDGYEGLMIRYPLGPYKCGRSTLKQGLLLKMKRFLDSEAKVIGFEEMMSNQNEAEMDELGYTKRSKAMAGLVPAGTLGKLIVEEVGDTPWKGMTFKVGTFDGFDHAKRKEIWDNQDKYLGKILTYKYQPHGIKTLPRIPVGKGFRSENDC